MKFRYDLDLLRRFKVDFVASQYQLTLHGSWALDEELAPGFKEEVWLLIAIDEYGEQLVEDTIASLDNRSDSSLQKAVAQRG